MSRRGKHYGYHNRPKASSWGDRTFEPGPSQNPDGEPVYRPEPHPPGLRGRQIGLYYRDRAMKNPGGKRKGEKIQRKPEDYILNLKIPEPVAQKLDADLKIILSHQANKSNIKEENFDHIIIKKEQVSEEFQENVDNVIIKKDQESEVFKENVDNVIINKEQVSEEFQENVDNVIIKKEYDSDSEEFQFKKPKIPDSPNYPLPNISSAPDFIPIKNNVSTNYGNDNRQLSHRGAGDFKYGYEDIITGSFDQKLDECLAKGIKINEKTNEIKDLSVALHKDYTSMQKDKRYLKYLEFRKKLPTYNKAKELIDVIKENQAVVISGETGCGKSTQVPQLILDDAIANHEGGNIRILVTQPRRIAALSLATRVAEERAEKLGTSVGYVMRLERVDCRERGSITFCTTGILLVDLEVDQGLTKYSHIILDEVHERDTHIDLAMCMLKKVLSKRKDLKLLLMSATIDADRLSAYYDNCPMMHIEGLAYPVEDIYMEDILRMTGYQLTENQNKNMKSKKHWKKKENEFNSGKAIRYRAEVGPWLESLRKKGKIDRNMYDTLSDFKIEDLNIELILTLLIHICQGPPGAVLVFLPGIGEISKLLRLMNESNAFPPYQYEIYPLHSKLPTVDQHKIFERPPNRIRKIIVATNIAETSITIDDIVYVIDCGKIKYNGLNVENHVTTLQTQWISKANLRQRRGRAGRCQPGVCYHMLTSLRAETLADRILPELQRSNLLEPVLHIKRLRLGLAETALTLVPDAPDMSTVKRAVKHLQQCGALDDTETLTPLGWHLARLPVHPAAGKLLVLGTLLGCLDRAASLAAVWSFKDPFVMLIGQEWRVEEVKKNFALGEPSDHIAMSEAIIQWENMHIRDRQNFAYNNFLAQNTLELLSDMKKQLGDNLKQMGFLTTGDVRSSWENRNANNLSIFKAVVAAALYPNIGSVRWIGIHKRFNPNLRIKVQTPEDGNIKLHPSSVMCVPDKRRGGGRQSKICCNNPGANWLVYWLKQRSTDLYLIDVTLVHTLSLLFFGESKIVEMEEETCLMSISKYKVRCSKKQANLLIELRKLLDDVLASKITVHMTHSTTYNFFEDKVLRAVIDIITAEDEGVDYFDDDGDTTGSDTSECEHVSKKQNV